MGHARQHRGACPRLRRRGKKTEGEQALGRSRGGFSTKLHGLADALGNPLAFSLTAGQQGDAPHARTLLDPVTTTAVIADKAYDTDAILEAIAAAGALAVIPPKATRVHQRATDWHLYQQRHKIEILFGFMKHYRRVFAHFEKLARRYLAFVHLVAACILLRRRKLAMFQFAVDPDSDQTTPSPMCETATGSVGATASSRWRSCVRCGRLQAAWATRGALATA